MKSEINKTTEEVKYSVVYAKKPEVNYLPMTGKLYALVCRVKKIKNNN